MKHYNPSVAEAYKKALNLKNGDFPQNEVSDFLQPVLNINYKNNIVRNGNDNTSGAGTIYTTPADKDFYLTSIVMNASSNATSDLTNVYVSISVEGVTRYFVLGTVTGVSNNVVLSQSFFNPIKLDRNTNISMSGTWTAGSARKTATITGYTEELINST